MRKKTLMIIAVVAVLVISAVGVDNQMRGFSQNHMAQAIEERYGGQAEVKLGGWPFMLITLTHRLADTQLNLQGIEVADEDRKATIDSVQIDAAGVQPFDDLENATVEQLDATASINWNQLSVLLGFPVNYVDGNRISVGTSVEVAGRVVPIQLEADLALEQDGTLELNDPGLAVADTDVPLPESVLQLALDQVSPDLKLPDPGGISYQSLAIGADAATITVTGQNVALSEFQ